jgi:hypothetical protein
MVNDSYSDAYIDDTNNNSAEILSDSSDSEEQVVQPEQIREHGRMCKGVSKQQITDSQLGLEKKIYKIQRPSFTGRPGFDTNIEITKDSTPKDIFQI